MKKKCVILKSWFFFHYLGRLPYLLDPKEKFIITSLCLCQYELNTLSCLDLELAWIKIMRDYSIFTPLWEDPPMETREKNGNWLNSAWWLSITSQNWHNSVIQISWFVNFIFSGKQILIPPKRFLPTLLCSRRDIIGVFLVFTCPL